VGSLRVCYEKPLPTTDEGQFLKEERRLIDAVAARLGQFVQHRELATVFERTKAETGSASERPPAWSVVLDLLRRTDLHLFRRISRKMLNHLSVNGVEEAKDLLLSLQSRLPVEGLEPADENRPQRSPQGPELERLASQTFEIAARHRSEEEILSLVQLWIREDRVSFLLEALESSHTTLAQIANVLQRYHYSGVDARQLSVATQTGIKAALVRRLLTEHVEFVEASSRYVEVEDFLDLMNTLVVLPSSHGRIGGKASGLFLARQILRRLGESNQLLQGIKVPKTWYLPSDGIVQFLAFNDLEDLYNWRYRDIDQIRQEYPHILQVFKSSRFAPETINGLSRALDDLGSRPLVVRSSSLLEDRIGSAFSGKYKSLFLANQGSKPERLAALMDAVAEVYASLFGPDPIQYRAERGLLEHHEEMGIMIQEVVGTRVGRYFLPAFAGVGFGNNELRWSPRIRREDGLLRLVPGLGTRAVDRLSDDYPILVAPGQPGLRVNVSPDEVYRYSPRRIDLINLETNRFETVDRHAFLREVGHDMPGITRLVSVLEEGHLRTPAGVPESFEKDNVLFTFEGLLRDTPLLPRMRALLDALRETLGPPADIEFASDGEDLYLLQCRPQSYAPDAAPAPIPRDTPEGQLLFTAHRYVSNGIVSDITHVVYVDPEGYAALGDASSLRDVGRAIGRLNKILPKRQFILIGPGRWGSRGDVKLGVSVTYADINNAALLAEVARKRGNYVPDLSFGTHFFQDLVESGIRYLPLYPDDAGVVFREPFFRGGENLLATLLPEFADLQAVVRVIDVPRATGGQCLRVLMNADLDEAVGMLAPAGTNDLASGTRAPAATRSSEDHSGWRLRMAQRLASELDPARFGVLALYVFGSTKNGTAGPGSDIDLILHVAGTQQQQRDLELWLEGWSLSLAEMNFLRTGYRSDGLLDVKLVTDDDIARHSTYAVKIAAVTDPARRLVLRSVG
jgi:pyruvate, water dikinase